MKIINKIFKAQIAKGNMPFAICLLLFAFSSCKTIKLPQEKALLTMPSTFVTAADTTNTAKVNWKTFFNDNDLTALVDTALQNNLDLLAAFQNIEIAKANLHLSKGLLKPTVTANVGAGITKYGNYTQEWAGNKTTEIENGKIIPQHLPDFQVGFQSNWEVDVWGKLKNKKQAALSRYFATVEGKNWLQTNLITEIANNYIELVALDNQKDIFNENIALQEQSLQLIKIQKETGRSNELAVKQFEAQILNVKATALELSQVQVEIENNINLLLGRYPQPIQRKKAAIETLALQKINEGIPSQLLQNRPDIRMAEQELIATRADVMAAKKAFYPSVNISAGIGFTAFRPGLLLSVPSIAYNILGGLAAPLINKTAIQAEFSTASAIQKTALYNYQESILIGFTEVYNQLKNINNLTQVYDIKKQEVALLDSAINAANLLFQTNRVTYLEVLTAQQNLLNAKIDLLQYQKQTKQTTVNLYKTLGGGL